MLRSHHIPTQTIVGTVATCALTALSALTLTMSPTLAAPADAQPMRYRISQTELGAAGDRDSREVSVSSDGRFVAFTSRARNLIANDTNGADDVFVHDRTTGAITRVSVTSAGVEGTGFSSMPFISSDGRYVVFRSESVLDPADTNVCSPGSAQCNDIYLHDRQTSVTALVTEAEWSPLAPEPRGVSPDGRSVLIHITPPNPIGPAVDFYILDPVARTTRVISQGSVGYGASPGGHAAMRDDAKQVIYSAGRAMLGPAGDPLPCRAGETCQRLYVHSIGPDTTTRIDPRITYEPDTHTIDLEFLDMSADGRFVLFFARLNRSRLPQAPLFSGAVYRYDRVTGETTFIEAEPSLGRVGAISDDGQVVFTCATSGLGGNLTLFNRFRVEGFALVPDATRVCEAGVAMNGDGRYVFFDARRHDQIVLPESGVTRHIWMVDRDQDNDGMSTAWESTYGLNINDPADTTLDADGDGVSNRDELLANTHPNGRVTRYFAEGAQNAFFETVLHLFNPGTVDAFAHITLNGQNGRSVTAARLVPAGRGLTVQPSTDERYGPLAPDAAFSTVIESNQLVVAERSMWWGRGADGSPAYGSHAETAMLAPRTDWHFAEGATGAYSLYYLLQNPGPTPAQVSITYLLGAGAPITHPYTVAPHSRRTIDVNGEPGLSAAEVSAHVTSDVPILAERAMYVSTPTQLYAGGHEGAAVPEPATEWFVAEGATGFFSLYLTVENPGQTDAAIEVTYLLDSGAPITTRHTARKQSRLTIDVAGEDPRLLTASLGAIVRSTNAVPVVVERVMWWPRAAPYEATLTAGALQTGQRWAVAGASSSSPGSVETYLLIASPSGAAGSVTVTLHGVDGGLQPALCEITRPLPASTRLTLSVGEVCDGVDRNQASTFAGTITSTTPIVAERATYGSTPDQFWATGAGAALTKLPDVP